MTAPCKTIFRIEVKNNNFEGRIPLGRNMDFLGSEAPAEAVVPYQAEAERLLPECESSVRSTHGHWTPSFLYSVSQYVLFSRKPAVSSCGAQLSWGFSRSETGQSGKLQFSTLFWKERSKEVSVQRRLRSELGEVWPRRQLAMSGRLNDSDR